MKLIFEKIDFGYYIFDLKKTGGEYKREKKNDGNKSEIMKKNGRYLIEWEYFV